MALLTQPALLAVAAIAAGGAAAAVGGWGADVEPVAGTEPTVRRAADCDLVASPSADRLDTASELVDSLEPGQVGCLRGGRYLSDRQIRIETPRITLAAYPGERATLRGRLWIVDGANGVTVEGLRLDGRNAEALPSPTVNADGVTFRGNEVTNASTAICFVIGDETYGRAAGTVIEGNKVHDCGRLPATNHDHGIYVAHADRTVIRNNWIYDNADRGVQLYPDAQQTLVVGNVIDGNGQGILFGGGEELASSGNVVRANAITNSSLRENVEASWAGPVGDDNLLAGNCVGGGVRDDGDGGIAAPHVGFSARHNVLESPRYEDRSAGDLRIVDRRCSELVGSG